MAAGPLSMCMRAGNAHVTLTRVYSHTCMRVQCNFSCVRMLSRTCTYAQVFLLATPHASSLSSYVALTIHAELHTGIGACVLVCARAVSCGESSCGRRDAAGQDTRQTCLVVQWLSRPPLRSYCATCTCACTCAPQHLPGGHRADKRDTCLHAASASRFIS